MVWHPEINTPEEFAASGIDGIFKGNKGIEIDKKTGEIIQYNSDGTKSSYAQTLNTVEIHSQHTNTNQDGGSSGSELAKYGQITTSYSSSSGVSVGPIGGVYEKGVVFTDKGWARNYTTKYLSPGFSSPSASGSLSLIAGLRGQRPTFSDWEGAMVGFSGSYDFISGNVGFTSTYAVFGLGLSYSPASLSIMKETAGGGSMSIGVTTWDSAPYQVGNLNRSGAGENYIHTQTYSGGQ